MYAIVGASGNTGSTVTEKLLDRGEKVRVIGRDGSKLSRWVNKGAEAITLDLSNTEGLTKAFQGVKAAYVMIPPNPSAPDVPAFQERMSDAVAAALEKASVPYAVVLSSIGADKAEKTGPVVILHNFEKKLDKIQRLNAVYLRAGYFMENILPQAEVIQRFGMLAGPVRPDLRLPLIATRDIGGAAAEILQDLNFTGKQARELQGQRDVSYAEVATIIGKAIGKPDLSYSQLPREQLKPALMGMGMSASMVNLLLEMSDALNSGHMRAIESRSGRNTTSTSIETFIAEEFVPRFQKKAASA
jgi:uncharacterized protein YbjT (DUF2867 family)